MLRCMKSKTSISVDFILKLFSGHSDSQSSSCMFLGPVDHKCYDVLNEQINDVQVI